MISREETFKSAFEIKKAALRKKQELYNTMLSAAYSETPRLSEIDREKSAVGSALVNAALEGGGATEKLKQKSAALTAEKKLLLEKAQVRPIEYDCPLCRDTGYDGSKICDCVKRLAAKIALESLSREMPLKESGFDNFNLNYYPDKDTPEGNPRRRMTGILKLCREYADNFNPHTSENLLFMGSSGLGKTHLTLAVVNEVTRKGFIPVYGPAENIFSALEREKFVGENRGTYESVINSDLLVIDDLGAEMATSFSKSALYNLVNTRILSGRPTVINTNLSMKEIEDRYTARVSSRLIGCFNAYKFLGTDIRQQKAVERMDARE